MWHPEELGEVIAERRMEFRRRGAKTKQIRVRFGRPVQKGRREPWWCPIEILGFGRRQFLPVGGVDSLQPLVLALEYVNSSLPVQARRAGGTIDWLGELESPVFAGSEFRAMHERSIINLKAGIKSAIPLVRNAEATPAKRRAVVRRLEHLLETSGFIRPRKRKA